MGIVIRRRSTCLSEEERKLIMEIVSDPRYTLESNIRGQPLAAALK